MDDDAVAGTVTIRYPDASTAEVSRLFVRARHRRHGIAQALLSQALADTRAHGCSSLRAIAMAGMDEGIGALRAAGFSEVNPFTEVPASWHPVVFLRATLLNH